MKAKQSSNVNRSARASTELSSEQQKIAFDIAERNTLLQFQSTFIKGASPAYQEQLTLQFKKLEQYASPSFESGAQRNPSVDAGAYKAIKANPELAGRSDTFKNNKGGVQTAPDEKGIYYVLSPGHKNVTVNIGHISTEGTLKPEDQIRADRLKTQESSDRRELFGLQESLGREEGIRKTRVNKLSGDAKNILASAPEGVKEAFLTRRIDFRNPEKLKQVTKEQVQSLAQDPKIQKASNNDVNFEAGSVNVFSKTDLFSVTHNNFDSNLWLSNI